MAKKTKTTNGNASLQTGSVETAAPVQIETPRVRAGEYLPLTPLEMTELRDLLDKPAFVKAWNNAQTCKPGVAIDTTGPAGAQTAAFRFHEIRGWELHAAALLAQTLPQKKRTPPQENFQPY